MNEYRDLLERDLERLSPPRITFVQLERRRERRQRNRRISAAVLAIIVAVVSFAGLARAFRSAERPADEPTALDIFAEVHGWIAYGDDRGIWAVDPTRPGDPNDQIQLSTEEGTPLAWSSDGSKLLILSSPSDPSSTMPRGLIVLNADGTQTHLATINDPIRSGGFINVGSFSPDGSQVIYVNDPEGAGRPSIYVVDTQGGTPRVLLAAGRRLFPELGREVVTWLFDPTYSPEGTQIAYVDGLPDHSHQLRVMNADGSGMRVLVDQQEDHIIHNIAWSPDGERLAFSLGRDAGIYIVGADGSGLALVVPDGEDPYWSPDGNRIAYRPFFDWRWWVHGLAIADLDGTHVQQFGYASPGPWNPLGPAESEGESTTNSGASPATALVSLTIVLALAAGILVIRRRKPNPTGGER